MSFEQVVSNATRLLSAVADYGIRVVIKESRGRHEGLETLTYCYLWKGLRIHIETPLRSVPSIDRVVEACACDCLAKGLVGRVLRLSLGTALGAVAGGVATAIIATIATYVEIGFLWVLIALIWSVAPIYKLLEKALKAPSGVDEAKWRSVLMASAVDRRVAIALDLLRKSIECALNPKCSEVEVEGLGKLVAERRVRGLKIVVELSIPKPRA